MAAASRKENESACLQDCEAITKVPIYSTTFYWKLQNFEHFQHKPGQYIRSPTFYTYGNDGERYQNVEWSLDLYPRGDAVMTDDEGNEDYPGLYLHCVKHSKEEISVTCRLCVGNVKDSSSFYYRTFNYVFKNTGGRGYEKFLRSKLEDDQIHLLDEEFVITCKVRHPGQPITTSVTPRSAAGYSERLDLLPMYQDGLLTDVTISTDTREFKVHKVVLAAKSNVFKTLLTSDFSEASSNAVKIADACECTCELMLLHMYGKKLPDDIDIDIAQALLYLSEKYEMDGLKTDCEVLLSSMISVTNVWRLLAASEKYRAETLKQCCKRFVSKNSKKILDVMVNNAGAFSECTLSGS